LAGNKKKYGDDSTNKEQYKVVYASAGHEVRSWYQKAGKTGLSQLIEAIRQDRSFAQAYQEAQGGILPDRSSTNRNYTSGPRAGGQ